MSSVNVQLAVKTANRLLASIHQKNAAVMHATSTVTSESPRGTAINGTTSDVQTPAVPKNRREYDSVLLQINNSVLPKCKVDSETTPSRLDGLDEKSEYQLRLLGCDLIQLAGKLLKLPQVAMATSCVLFQRFYYCKSLVRFPFETLAMASLVLSCKIEECLRRTRDIVNVFHHIKQVRSGRKIEPMVLDGHYISLKNEVIKAERRLLKELGFCVHVKHPHKIIVMYLKWLNKSEDRLLLQMSWNFMNDAHRSDVFVRYSPELIAAACIHLSALRMRIPLPTDRPVEGASKGKRKHASWLHVLFSRRAEHKVMDCCHRIVALYTPNAQPDQSELEAKIATLQREVAAARKRAAAAASSLPDAQIKQNGEQAAVNGHAQINGGERRLEVEDVKDTEMHPSAVETKNGATHNTKAAASVAMNRVGGGGGDEERAKHHQRSDGANRHHRRHPDEYLSGVTDTAATAVSGEGADRRRRKRVEGGRCSGRSGRRERSRSRSSSRRHRHKSHRHGNSGGAKQRSKHNEYDSRDSNNTLATGGSKRSKIVA